MKNSEVLAMIDQGLEDFENDKKNEKNLRMILNFSSSSIEYNEQKFNFQPPKLKKKLTTGTYIKKTGNNQLF